MPGSPHSLSSASRLPLRLTSFVGRERELAELAGLLRGARLVTLTGAGGSGKTRLALEVCARLAGEDPAGVAWVELAPVGSGDQLPHEVATALAIPLPGGRDVTAALLDHLRDRSLLLVLDNCEHVVDAAARFVEALLRECAGLRVLTTSREALGVAGERAWLVPPLSLPGSAAPADGAALAESEAVRLFAERARAASRGFDLTPEHAAAVAQICRRLDGLPLAIELAAARVRALSPAQIAARLDDSFRLLTSGARTAIPRHRTLRGVFDWSFGLLDEREQRVLRRLAVFAGGFTLEAAEVICTSEDVAPEHVLDLLEALIGKSLLVANAAGGEVRYELLETVRQYGRDRLREAGELDTYGRRHAEHFLALAEAAEPHIFVGEDQAWMERLELEFANLWAALDSFEAAADGAEPALRLLSALEWFFATGRYRQARRALSAILDRGGDVAITIHARALTTLGFLAFWDGDPPAMLAAAARSLELLGDEGDPRARVRALTLLGLAQSLLGDRAGDAALARAVAIARPHGDALLILAAGFRGHAAEAVGDAARARECYEEAAREAHRLGMGPARANLAAGLGRALLALGEVDAAAAAFRDGLAARATGIGLWGVTVSLLGLAEVAARRGRAERAARLLGAADVARERVGTPLRPDEHAQRNRLRGALETALEPAALDAARAEGAGFDLERAVAYACAEDAPASRAPAEPTAAASRESPPALRVGALGRLTIERDGRPLPPAAWSYAKPRELLLYLLCHPDGRTREQVGVALWPEASTAQVKNNFHVTLHHLRKALGGPDWVTLDGERYLVNRDRRCVFDVVDFEREIRAVLRQRSPGAEVIPRLQQALALYRGDFLEGERVGDWHLEVHDRLRRLLADGTLLLGSLLDGGGARAEAADVYRRLVQIDELHEEGHRRLMEALTALGERTQAMRQYERLAALLRDQHDAVPAPETIAVYERLRGARQP